jgi:hypothetical protein
MVVECGEMVLTGEIRSGHRTGEAVYLQRDIEAPKYNHCCSEKAISIT